MKITVTLPKGSGIMLEEFSKLKLCGDSLEENASYLMLRAISDLAGTVGFRHITEALKKRLETPTATIVPLKSEPVARGVLIDVVQETEEDRIARENWQAANLITSTSAPAPVITATIEKPALIKSQKHNAQPLASAALLLALTPGQAAVLKVYREAAGAVMSLSEVGKAAGVPSGSVSFHRQALVDKGYATAEKTKDGRTSIKVIVDESVPIAKPKTVAPEGIQKSAARALGDEIARDAAPPAEAPAVVADPGIVLIDDLSVRMKILMRGILTFGPAPPRTTAQLSRHSGIEESKLPFLLNRLRELKLIEGNTANKWILTSAGVELAKQVPADLSLNGGKPETKLSFPIVRIQDTTPAAKHAAKTATFGKTLTDQQREAIDKHMATKGARTFEAGASAEPWLMQEQLQKKGHTVSRTAGGGWMVDGRRKEFDEVVAMINKYRAAVDLPPLTAPK